MHQYKALLQIFLLERIKGYRKGHKLTQEAMAESCASRPAPTPIWRREQWVLRHHADVLFPGPYGEEILQMLADFRALVEAESMWLLDDRRRW